jgi:hypothetical protein
VRKVVLEIQIEALTTDGIPILKHRPVNMVGTHGLPVSVIARGLHVVNPSDDAMERAGRCAGRRQLFCSGSRGMREMGTMTTPSTE